MPGPAAEAMFVLGWELGHRAAKDPKTELTLVEKTMLEKYSEMRRTAELVRKYGSFTKAAGAFLRGE